jgi:hypothetical protein
MAYFLFVGTGAMGISTRSKDLKTASSVNELLLATPGSLAVLHTPAIDGLGLASLLNSVQSFLLARAAYGCEAVCFAAWVF